MAFLFVPLRLQIHKQLYMFKENRGEVLHGVLLIVLFSFSAFYIAEFDFVKRLSFSPLIVGIVLGMLYANSLRNKLPQTWVPGIKFCSKQILRTGVVLYGFKLTFQQVLDIGLPAITADVIIVAGTLLWGILLGKLLKIDSQTALMTSTGSAICGAAAVLGAEPSLTRRLWPFPPWSFSARSPCFFTPSCTAPAGSTACLSNR